MFRSKYRSYCESYPVDVLDKTLRDRLRTYRSKNALEISAYKSAVSVDVSDPSYLLCYLQDLLLRTPDFDVVGEGVDGLGNPYVRRKSNRSEICKIIGLILSISGYGDGGSSVSFSLPFSRTGALPDISDSGGSDVAS